MTMTLAISSMVFTICVYLAKLFIEGDAHIVWLVVSMIMSTSILVLSIYPIAFFNRKKWLIALLIFHIIIYAFGATFIDGGLYSFSIVFTPLNLFWGFIILLTLIMIYRAMTHNYLANNHPLPMHAKTLHILNMISGLFVIPVGIYFFTFFLAIAYSGNGFSGIFKSLFSIFYTFFPLLLILLWLVLYIIQIKLVRKKKVKIAYSIVCLPVSGMLIILAFLFGIL